MHTCVRTPTWIHATKSLLRLSRFKASQVHTLRLYACRHTYKGYVWYVHPYKHSGWFCEWIHPSVPLAILLRKPSFQITFTRIEMRKHMQNQFHALNHSHTHDTHRGSSKHVHCGASKETRPSTAQTWRLPRAGFHCFLGPISMPPGTRFERNYT